ncbi:MAG TPA: NAD(P)/FAD-dependent oxidoreductase [Candidatus Dormibacteraeota bacterium]
MLETEIAVVGSGPAGATAALLLARRGHHVVVLDRARFPRDKACGEGLMPPGVAVLRRLGLYDAVVASGARSLLGVTYRQQRGGPAAHASFPNPPKGDQVSGLGIRRTAFDAVLVDALRQESNLTLREGERVTGLARDDAGAVNGVHTASGAVRAGIVIGADGLHSSVRSWAGLATPAATSSRYGLAGHWRVDTRGRTDIRVTFCDGHEWYEAPVGPDELLVSVLTGRSGPHINTRTYEAATRAAVPAVNDAPLVAGPLGAAQFEQRTRVAEGNVFLVGDAAGYDDPTTGEGLAIGMLLAERLALRIHHVRSGRTSAKDAVDRYRADHARLVRDRHRLTRLALIMARTPWLSRRAIASASKDPRALSKLLGINCGYQTFAALTPRDWLSLAGI